jgi:hypothetical protein
LRREIRIGFRARHEHWSSIRDQSPVPHPARHRQSAGLAERAHIVVHLEVFATVVRVERNGLVFATGSGFYLLGNGLAPVPAQQKRMGLSPV